MKILTTKYLVSEKKNTLGKNTRPLKRSVLDRVNVTFLNLPVMTVCRVNFNNSRSAIPV